MVEGSGKTKEISLGDGFGDVALKVNGATIQVHADGSIQAYTSGNVDAYTNGSVKLHPAANDSSATAEPKTGDKMPDGTIYAGVSPNTGRAMYATALDASLTMTFNEAKEYASKLDAHGHQDWRVPTKGELNVLFNNRAAIGGFNETGSDPAGWYWSASQNGTWSAWAQRFSDGGQDNSPKDIRSSVRCVRG
jgi:hypothetical protein